MVKLNFLGIGPRIAMVLFLWLTATIIFSTISKGLFGYTSGKSSLLLFSGIATMAIGLAFYFSTVRLLLQGLKETRLLTNGPYRLCQNPLYSSIILFIIPSLSLILNSWLILTSSITGYIIFRIYIKREYYELEKKFGENYIKYKNETQEFFPVPLK